MKQDVAQGTGVTSVINAGPTKVSVPNPKGKGSHQIVIIRIVFVAV